MDDWKLQPAKDLGLGYWQRLRSAHRESGLMETAAHLGWGSLVKGYLRLFHRLRITGLENLPARPPFVLVANHCSHLDAMALASILPMRLRDCTFPVAAGDHFFETPAMAMFAAGIINALPVSRRGAGRHALDDLRRRLLDECCVYILFPEGTRSRDGSMGRFKAGIGMLLAGTEVPIVPCHLRGTFDAWPAHQSRPRPAPIRLRIGEPMTFAGGRSDRAEWDHIAGDLEAAVKKLGESKSP